MWKRWDYFKSKQRQLCLTLLIYMLMCMTATFWTSDFENEQRISYTLSPYPQNHMLHYEASLCSSSSNTPIKPPPHHNIHCPQKPIVTVRQIGRLGNQMYEYISTLAAAKRTGREPYVPSCLIQELEKVFQNLTLAPLSYLAYCTIKRYPVSIMMDNVEHSNESILLPDYAQLHTYVVPLLSDIQQMFQFKKHIVDESQRLLHSASRGVKNITYVGVHVRRTDYKRLLKVLFNASMVKPDYFLRQMNVFRSKYKPVMFVVVSDDPGWCERELRSDDVVVMSARSPAQDLAIMAACNHSIIDYGTYGMWGAILAGGDTFVYNLSNSYDGAYQMASLLPNWHIVS